MTNPRVPPPTAPQFITSRGGLYRVGPKCFTSLGEALRWGIVLERPVEQWVKDRFVEMDWRVDT
jgi:hypothetical protein